MPESFWWNVGASLIGELVAGAVIGLIFGVIVSELLGVRKWAAEQRREGAYQVEAAVKYIGLLRGEVDGIMKAVPTYCEALAASPTGQEVPIYTPVWDVVRGSGQLATLLDPDLLTQTAYFYGNLEYAKETMRWLILSWYVPEGAVNSLGQIQMECRDATVKNLRNAETQAKKVLELYGEEEKRLTPVEAQ